VIADDCRERLDLAVGALADHTPMHQRLRSVADHLLPCMARDFRDPANGALLEEIRSALTAVGDPGDDGAVEMTLLAMSDAQAQSIAQKVWLLHARVKYPHLMPGTEPRKGG
jgi:hypothetical protein